MPNRILQAIWMEQDVVCACDSRMLVQRRKEDLNWPLFIRCRACYSAYMLLHPSRTGAHILEYIELSKDEVKHLENTRVKIVDL